MVAKVATQGIYKTVNTKKVNELKGVKIVIRALFKDVKWEDDVKTERVETTVSLAVIPVINAVEALQSSKPNGLNNGEKMVPIDAKILWELFSTISNWKLKLCKNQIIIDDNKITVKALWTNPLALS